MQIYTEPCTTGDIWLMEVIIMVLLKCVLVKYGALFAGIAHGMAMMLVLSADSLDSLLMVTN